MDKNEQSRNGPAPGLEAARPDADALTGALQLGDPASDAPEIDALELARMRRTIVTAADDAQDMGVGSWTWLNVSRPLAVAFATIVVALFAVWLFTPTPGSGPGAPAEIGGQAPGAVVDTARPGSAEPGEATVADATQPDTLPEAPSSIPDSTLPDPPIEGTVPAEQIAPTEQVTPPQTLEPQPIVQPDTTPATTIADTSPPDKHARTVQFTAPHGTRIIWTLDPNFVSPLTEQDARQEQEK